MAKDNTKRKRSRYDNDLSIRKLRSALSNGTTLFGGDVDLRGSWVRRFRDLLHGYHSDLGGEDYLSEGQRALVRRAAMIQLQLEMVETRWAETNDGKASLLQLHRYQTSANRLRRLVETLDLHRGPKVRDITPRALAMLEADAA